MLAEEIEKLPYRPCVGVMLANADGAIFVGQRIDSDLPAWQMPQGGIDPGEDVRSAALRELWEETGIGADLVEFVAEAEDWVRYDLPHDLVPRIWKGKYRGQQQKWVLLRYRGDDGQIDIAGAHPEFSSWRWLAPDAVVAQIVPFKRAVYEQALRALRPYL